VIAGTFNNLILFFLLGMIYLNVSCPVLKQLAQAFYHSLIRKDPTLKTYISSLNFSLRVERQQKEPA